MRAVLFLVLIAGCDFGICGLDPACTAVFAPDVGAWVGDPAGWSDSCADELWPSGDWTLAPGGEAFAFAAPGVGEADCTRDDRAWSCAPSAIGEVVVSHDGSFLARSEGVATVALSAPACEATAEVPLLAGWRHAHQNPDAPRDLFQEWLQNFGGNGSGGGYSPGSCPRDWEKHEELSHYGCDAGVEVTVRNLSDQNLSLFQAGIYLVSVLAGQDMTSHLCPDSIYALGTDFNEDACVWSFRVDGPGTHTYPPE